MIVRALVILIATAGFSGVAHAQEADGQQDEALTASVDAEEMERPGPSSRAFEDQASPTEVASGSLFGIRPGEPLPSTRGFEEFLDNDGLGHRVLNWSGEPLTLKGEPVSSLVVRVRDGLVTQIEVSLVTDRKKDYSTLRDVTDKLCEHVGTLRRNKTGHLSTNLMVKGKCRGDVENDIFVLVQERHSSNQDTKVSRSAVEITVRVPAPPRSVMRGR